MTLEIQLTNCSTLRIAAALVLASSLTAQAQQPAAPAQTPIKIGIVTFLTGPAAAPFGIPGRNAAEILVEMLNAGKLPAPYNTVGLGGAKIETKYVDEAGSTAQQVTEFRNLVQRDKVDVVVGYVSSGNCLAVAPVAEELKALTVIDVCGTPRLDRKKDITVYSGINQNYAWGQDSWRDFQLAMKTSAPRATVDKVLFPKLFAGEFGAEISALLTSRSQIIHSSFYDGDLESFIFQSTARGLPQRMPLVLTTGETALARLGTKMPDGMIIGARGSHGLMAKDSELNRWFQQVYADRFSMAPTYPSYHAAQSLLGLKAAWEKAQAKKGGARPTTDEVIAAFEGLEFQTPSTTIRLAIGRGHQGISDISYGTNRFNKAEGRAEIVDVVRYPAECVNPPADVDSQAWLEGGMKGAKCN